jgi:penicillin-binding protein 1C
VLHPERGFAARRGRIAKRCLKWGALLVAMLWIAWLLLPKPELLPPGAEFSRVVLDRDGRVLFITLTADEKYRLPAKLADLSPEMIAATLEMEDRRFYSHHGADVRSLARSAWGVVSRQRLGGGSTLTMQYARLRWHLDTRSVWGKLTQVFRAVQLERHYGKTAVAEAYFTFAPYGGNVEGVEAASLLWCGKQAQDLSLREAAALSVIPQSPTKRRPKTKGNPALESAQGRLMARLRANRGEPASELDAAFSLRPVAAPRLAPHFARWTVAQASSPVRPTAILAGGSAAADSAAIIAAGRTGWKPVLRTTLDLAQQQTIERSMTDFLSRERSHGLRNAAAILIHAPTHEVRAYVGSAGFFDVAICGQVDGVKARRSPGSALKPFIYGLAFDAGLIHPRTLLDDAPRRFATYNPENSDRGFLGPIPAGEALRRSRNVPAVELLARLPGGGLDSFLRDAGVQLARPRGEYGLSLALGGAEVSLEEVAMLYTGLIAPEGGKPALSPAARWLVLDALRGNEPGAPGGLAWKTGTSHGFRDTWACGVMGEWVLCVWVGNFDGKPMPGLFARYTAAPLLFQTITRLGLRGKIPPRPPDVASVELCGDSGALAGAHCPHRTHGNFIAGVSPIDVCSVHRQILLDENGRRVALTDGRPGLRRVVAEFWPAQRLEQFRRAGLPRKEPPQLARDDTARDSGTPPRIVSPQNALTYVLHVGDTAKNSIPLEADAAAEAREIHWFAGAHYLGASAPSHPLMWKAAPGRWMIQAVDDSGRVAKTSVTIVAAQ